MLVLASNQTVEKYPYTLGNLRKDNPNVSFPKSPSDDQLAPFNVFRVERTEKPSFNEATQKCEEVNPVFQNGKWVQVWSVVSIPAAEQEQRTKNREDRIRGERNYKIIESDWTQLPDAPVNKQAWAIYRQALRDIPEQTGFPWDVQWPTKPE